MLMVREESYDPVTRGGVVVLIAITTGDIGTVYHYWLASSAILPVGLSCWTTDNGVHDPFLTAVPTQNQCRLLQWR